jgi:hypothetical protein
MNPSDETLFAEALAKPAAERDAEKMADILLEWTRAMDAAERKRDEGKIDLRSPEGVREYGRLTVAAARAADERIRQEFGEAVRKDYVEYQAGLPLRKNLGELEKVAKLAGCPLTDGQLDQLVAVSQTAFEGHTRSFIKQHSPLPQAFVEAAAAILDADQQEALRALQGDRINRLLESKVPTHPAAAKAAGKR